MLEFEIHLLHNLKGVKLLILAMPYHFLQAYRSSSIKFEVSCDYKSKFQFYLAQWFLIDRSSSIKFEVQAWTDLQVASSYICISLLMNIACRTLTAPMETYREIWEPLWTVENLISQVWRIEEWIRIFQKKVPPLTHIRYDDHSRPDGSYQRNQNMYREK
jgi:hypothetical protein